ncbi:helix-turn-helix domain-containing protein [Aquimarina pacifica]|uniref:helix-turn-helix domain-containing protein n=1 Tax=Aquimarina pacifica TaxID=1296415 RepID=UPI00046F907D|nr:helix-turn-helix domain-containing protein [Aquimarina pacifica]
MNDFGIIDLILVLGISQGFFLAITLQLVRNKNISANKILSIILIMAAFMLFGRVVFFRYSGILLHKIAGYADAVIFVFGPLVYMYVRRLTFKESPAYKLSLYHYIPLVLILTFCTWTLFYTKKELMYFAKTGVVPLVQIFNIIVYGALISNFLYCFKSYRLVNIFKKEEKNNLSYSQSVIPFLYTFLGAITLFLLLWTISFMSRYFKIYNLYFFDYDYVWISIPIFVYVVGFYSLRQPEIFRVPLKITAKKKKNKNRLQGEMLKQLQDDLEYLMVTEKVYLDNTLTLQGLSEKLGFSTNDVSWLLNNIHQCTFYDYINQYRVQAFIEKIERGEHNAHTLLALSLDSGFNSKSTFNKAFKTLMNDTPTEYIKKLTVI